MATLNVKQEVLSHCNKCHLALPHTIVTMKSQTSIGKVECKTCQSTHLYKNPAKVKAKKNLSGAKAKKASSTSESISDMWLEAVGKSKTKSQDYSLEAKFQPGDIIDHPKFGPGIVDHLIDENKIQVIFRHEIKVLLHNRANKLAD